MIVFSCRCYHKDRTPIVKDLYIQEYAEAIVRDYRPELLVTSGKIDAFHFLESYLGVTVEFQDIFYPEGNVPVAGATIFNDEAIMVFDRSGMKVSSIDIPAGTVLIDNATMKSESFALFTALHEGGHYCMHQGVYKLDPDQISLFESEGHHFMETVQTSPPHREDNRCKAISELIEAVAKEQEALARILEAEHKKIEKTVELCRTNIDDLVKIDKSVERVLAAVTRLELALQLKLDLFHNCLCPDTPCAGDSPCHK